MEEITTAELTEKGQQMMTVADAYEDLADSLRNAESIADDVPVLSELFHKARTTHKNPRDGRFVALLDYDADADEWTCRNVSWLQQGTHYHDTGADAVLGFSPYPFCSVDRFAEEFADTLRMDAKEQRQNASLHRTDARGRC